jgi:hypothetical protein
MLDFGLRETGATAESITRFAPISASDIDLPPEATHPALTLVTIT